MCVFSSQQRVEEMEHSVEREAGAGAGRGIWSLTVRGFVKS